MCQLPQFHLHRALLLTCFDIFCNDVIMNTELLRKYDKLRKFVEFTRASRSIKYQRT